MVVEIHKEQGEAVSFSEPNFRVVEVDWLKVTGYPQPGRLLAGPCRPGSSCHAPRSTAMSCRSSARFRRPHRLRRSPDRSDDPHLQGGRRSGQPRPPARLRPGGDGWRSSSSWRPRQQERSTGIKAPSTGRGPGGRLRTRDPAGNPAGPRTATTAIDPVTDDRGSGVERTPEIAMTTSNPAPTVRLGQPARPIRHRS